MSNMLCYLKNSKEESRIFLHSGFLAEFSTSNLSGRWWSFQSDLVFLEKSSRKNRTKTCFSSVFVWSRLQNNKKSCFVGCFPGIWRECYHYPLILFGLPSKFYHLFYKKAIPFLQKPTSGESPVIAFFLAPSPTWLWYLTCISSSKEATTSWWTDKGGSFWGEAWENHWTPKTYKMKYIYIYHRIHVGKIYHSSHGSYGYIEIWCVFFFVGIGFCIKKMIEFLSIDESTKWKAPVRDTHLELPQGSATRGQLASREGYPDLEKQPTCGTDRLPKISRACMWETHEILRKVILNGLAATKVVLSLYGLIMFMYPVFCFHLSIFSIPGSTRRTLSHGKINQKNMDR